MKLEKDIEKKCVKYALSKGVPSDKLVTPGRRGPADRIFWHIDGKPWIVEFKRDENSKISKHQELFAKKLRVRGYDVSVIWDYDTFCKELHAMLKCGWL
jgi:hypothetical protein